MGKFCAKCGRPINQQFGRCAYCAEDSVRNGDRNMNTGRTERRGGLKALLIVLCGVLLIGSMLALLVQFNFISLPGKRNEVMAPEWGTVMETERPVPPQGATAPPPETTMETMSQDEREYLDTVTHCEILYGQEGAIPVVGMLQVRVSSEPMYADLLAEYEAILKRDTLDAAAGYEEQWDYRQAALTVSEAQRVYDCKEFRDRMEFYTAQLSISMSAIYVLEDSNYPGKKEDVAVGDWADIHGDVRSGSVKFWVVDRENYHDTEYVVYDIGSDYVTLSGWLVSSEKSDAYSDAIIKIYLDNKLVYTSPLVTSTSDPIYFEIDVTDASKMRVECTTDSANFFHCIMDATLSQI